VVVREAGGAGKVAPHPARAGFIGAALGIVLGLALAFLAHALDSRVREEEEIREAVRIPLLGRLPRQVTRQRRDSPAANPFARVFRRDRRNGLVMLDEPWGVGAQSFRMLAATLDVAVAKSGIKTVMVTSAVPREGKTTTVANLAIALARHGRSVALLDFDFHAPKLHEMFGVDARHGASNLLFGRTLDHVDPSTLPRNVVSAVDSDDAWSEVDVSGPSPSEREGDPASAGESKFDGGRVTLKLLCAGPLRADIADAAPAEGMMNIIRDVRERVDVVLIDTPPILVSGAAVALAAEVEGIVVVSRLNVLRTRALDELRRVLESCPGTKLGFVVTGADGRAVYGGYKYGYGRIYPFRDQRPEVVARDESRDSG
jgi:non-specific protein-tyrosine kinase